MTTSLTIAEHDVLLAAYGPAPAAQQAWQRWRDSIDWDGPLPGDAFRLLPIIRQHLQGHGVDDALFPRCLGIARQSWLRNQQRRAQLRRWLAAWPVADVLVLPPSDALFVDGTRVHTGDTLSLAIRPEAAVPVVRHLLAHAPVVGPVRPPRRQVPGFVRGAAHLAVTGPDLGTVSVTWRLDYWLGDRWMEAWYEAQHEARPADRTVDGLRTLSPTDRLALLLRHHVGARPLGWAVDLLATDVTMVDWAVLARTLAAQPMHPEAIHLLQTVAPLRSDWPLAAPGWLAFSGSGRSVAGPPTPTGAPRRPLQRWRADWRRYRAAWGTEFRWPTAVLQLPGYALARWRVPALAQLPHALWRWLNLRQAAR
jgi:hypothetical protein